MYLEVLFLANNGPIVYIRPAVTSIVYILPKERENNRPLQSTVIISVRYTLIQQRGNKFPWGYKVVIQTVACPKAPYEAKFQHFQHRETQIL